MKVVPEKCSPLSYGYTRQGKQKQIYQPHKRGRRLSVLGFWQPKQCFEYAVMVGSIKSERYIHLMECLAQKAAAHKRQNWTDYRCDSGQCFVSQKPIGATALFCVASAGVVCIFPATAFTKK